MMDHDISNASSQSGAAGVSDTGRTAVVNIHPWLTGLQHLSGVMYETAYRRLGKVEVHSICSIWHFHVSLVNATRVHDALDKN